MPAHAPLIDRRIVQLGTLLALCVCTAAPALAVVPQSKPGTVASRPHPGQNGTLTKAQEQLARAAWKYFENNYQPSTCLYNSVDGYPSATMWDTASAMAGLVSAMELELIAPPDFDDRMECLLASLNRMPLWQDELPNKAYNTITLDKVDYTNQPGEIGVSAIDLGRLLTWLAIVKERYPAHADAVDRIVLRWKFCNLIDRGGTLYGAQNDPAGGVRYLQEGRLGYEEYAANGFQLWGFETPDASRQEPYEEVGIYGVPIAYDGRDPALFGAHNYVVTEAFLLDGLELNWDVVGDTNPSDGWQSDPVAATLAKRVYQVQAKRYAKTGILTARTEHQIDGPPYFVYDTIYSDGVPWNTISDDGKPWPDLAAVATKAAVGLSVLFDTKYTALLEQAVLDKMVVPDKGLYEGFYEKDGRPIATFTANTNGIVLETLLYKKEGKLYRGDGAATLWDSVPNHEFPGITQCLPARPPPL
jgi:hypothetical protein